MNTAILLLAAAAALSCADAGAARLPDAQEVMKLDLNACPRPAWPAVALAQRASGTTTVEVRIGDQGVVTDARVLDSSGRTDLDDAALAGIRRCVFHAVLTTGQAPTGWLTTRFVWVPGAARQQEAQDQALFDSTQQLAASGDAIAQNRLGAWYQHGTYGKVDFAQAASWYLLAAQQGNAVAQNNLGVLYHRGAGVPYAPKQAVAWYARAAAQGHHWAQANLAWYYQHGGAGELDPDKALYWFTKAAEGGLAPAQVQLGIMTMQRAASDAERTAGAAWFARAAARNDPAGIYYLGRTFELGLGNAQDDAEAAALYRKALTRSAGRAETALGMLLEAGRAGPPDAEQAATLYQMATKWRYPAAFYHYALALERHGDTALATAVFRQGAELGNCAAVAKYVPLRQGAALAGDMPDEYWEQRARYCAALPVRPPQL